MHLWCVIGIHYMFRISNHSTFGDCREPNFRVWWVLSKSWVWQKLLCFLCALCWHRIEHIAWLPSDILEHYSINLHWQSDLRERVPNANSINAKTLNMLLVVLLNSSYPSEDFFDNKCCSVSGSWLKTSCCDNLTQKLIFALWQVWSQGFWMCICKWTTMRNYEGECSHI